MEEKYRVALGCRYWEDKHIILFPNEYVIKFKSYNSSNPIPLVGKFKDIGKDEDWCIIDKSDLIKKIDDENGLVGVYLNSIEKDKALIGINDTGDHRISMFSVPKSELVYLVSEKEGMS